MVKKMGLFVFLQLELLIHYSMETVGSSSLVTLCSVSFCEIMTDLTSSGFPGIPISSSKHKLMKMTF